MSGETDQARLDPCPQGADVLVRKTDNEGVFTLQTTSGPRPELLSLPSTVTLLDLGSSCPVFKEDGSGRGTRPHFKAMWPYYKSGETDPQTPWSPGTFFWDTPRGGRRRALEDMALPRASSEHSPSWQGHPHQGTDSCPIPQIRAPERRAGLWGNGLEADTFTRTQAGLCHSPSPQGAVVCLGLLGGLYPRSFPLGLY